MKTSERHHLKDNELAIALGQGREFAARHQRNLGITIGVVVLIAIAAGGFFAWRRSVETSGRELLAQAMVISEARVMAPTPAPPDAKGEVGTPTQQPGTYPTEKEKLEAALPKFVAAADQYPTTDAGRTARYHVAATLVALGRFDDATKQYDQVIGAGGLLGEMARLGKAEAQVRAAQFDPAITSLKELSEKADGNLPKEGVLLELARAYKLAGKTDDARNTLNVIVEKHAESPFAAEARQELDKMPGAAPVMPPLEKPKG
jgi:tetratricopeptide (TPR) repeat protein